MTGADWTMLAAVLAAVLALAAVLGAQHERRRLGRVLRDGMRLGATPEAARNAERELREIMES